MLGAFPFADKILVSAAKWTLKLRRSRRHLNLNLTHPDAHPDAHPDD
jgi:hypothetical protein